MIWAATPSLLVHIQADNVSAVGQVSTVKLADGTRVILSPEGAIAADIGDRERRVTLLRGSAYFDVTHDAGRPFRVAAGDSETTVLGTAFEIRLKTKGASVAVRRGLVQIASLTTSAREKVAAGQSLDMRSDGTRDLRPIDRGRIATWIEGRIVVEDRPVAEVIDAIRPWYSGYILTGGGLRNRRVTGVYDLRDPDAALRALDSIQGITVRRVSPWIRIVRAS